MSKENAYLFVIVKYFSFAFFPFIPFAKQLFCTPVTSSNLCNQAPLFTELSLLPATVKRLFLLGSDSVQLKVSCLMITQVYNFK